LLAAVFGRGAALFAGWSVDATVSEGAAFVWAGCGFELSACGFDSAPAPPFGLVAAAAGDFPPALPAPSGFEHPTKPKKPKEAQATMPRDQYELTMILASSSILNSVLFYRVFDERGSVFS
jgi:hypothetical protein